MKIEFDPGKDARNRLKHGLSLAAFRGFDVTVGAEIDDRFDYGERRYRALGRIDGLAYAIVYAERATGIRLISFRRAHEKELRRYDQEPSTG